MKILAFTDPHTDEAVLKEVGVKVKDADLLICPGDIAWLGEGADRVIDYFEKWEKELLLIHGNHEFEEEVATLCKKKKHVKFIHKKIVVKNNIMFIGWGGDWYHQRNSEFKKWIKKNSKAIKSHKGKLVLIVHLPVYETATDYLHGDHRGNISYREFIEEYKPNLVLCGHFHETFHLRDKIGDTLVVNPGQDGEFFEL